MRVWNVAKHFYRPIFVFFVQTQHPGATWVKCCENFFYKPSVRRQHGSNAGETCVKRCAASLDTIFLPIKKEQRREKERRCSSRRQNRDGICDGKDDGNGDRQFDGNMTATFIKPPSSNLLSIFWPPSMLPLKTAHQTVRHPSRAYPGAILGGRLE